MTFHQYLATLNGKLVTLWIDQLSARNEYGVWSYIGYLEVHQDFVLAYPGDGDVPTAFRIKDIMSVEVIAEVEEEPEEEEEEDLLAKFEKYYRQIRG